MCRIGQIVVDPRVLPQLPAAEVQDPRVHGIFQSPVQAAGGVVLLLLLVLVLVVVLVDSRAPVGSAGAFMVL